MIRGVNRQIIDVSQTESEFFERALLFVRPEYAALNDERLRHEANKMLASIGSLPVPAPRRAGGRKNARLFRRRFAFFALLALASLLCAALLSLLLR